MTLLFSGGRRGERNEGGISLRKERERQRNHRGTREDRGRNRRNKGGTREEQGRNKGGTREEQARKVIMGHYNHSRLSPHRGRKRERIKIQKKERNKRGMKEERGGRERGGTRRKGTGRNEEEKQKNKGGTRRPHHLPYSCYKGRSVSLQSLLAWPQ
jgi:hypothetical protein